MSAQYELKATFYCSECTRKASTVRRGNSAQGLAAQVRDDVRAKGWDLNTNGRGADRCPSHASV